MTRQYMIAVLDADANQPYVSDEGEGSFDTEREALRAAYRLLDLDAPSEDRKPQHVLSVYSIDTKTGAIETHYTRNHFERVLAEAEQEETDAAIYGAEGTAERYGVAQSWFFGGMGS